MPLPAVQIDREQSMGVGKAVASGVSVVAIGAVVVLGVAVGVAALALKAIDAWVAFLPPRRK